jgi:hypothetical protein
VVIIYDKVLRYLIKREEETSTLTTAQEIADIFFKGSLPKAITCLEYLADNKLVILHHVLNDQAETSI